MCHQLRCGGFLFSLNYITFALKSLQACGKWSRPFKIFRCMIIDFNSIDLSVMPNFKGGEKELAANMFFDGTNRIFKGRLVPGATIGMHTHDDSCEVIFILEGSGTIVEGLAEDQRVLPVKAGDCLYCEKGQSHSLRNTAQAGDLVFYAVVAKQ